jgi:hypothetical protein
LYQYAGGIVPLQTDLLNGREQAAIESWGEFSTARGTSSPAHEDGPQSMERQSDLVERFAPALTASAVLAIPHARR